MSWTLVVVVGQGGGYITPLQTDVLPPKVCTATTSHILCLGVAGGFVLGKSAQPGPPPLWCDVVAYECPALVPALCVFSPFFV